MRILLISHTCQSAVEGQPKAEQLSRLPGIDLCVLVPDRWNHYGAWRSVDPPNPAANYSLKIQKIGCPWLGPAQSYLHWYPQMSQLIESFQPDIIDLWEEPWALVSAQACRLRDRNAPSALILSETEQNLNKTLPPPFQQFRSYTLSRADWAIGRSTEAVKVIRARGYQGPATVVPNAVDADLFKPMDKTQCREKLGLTGFVVGFVGRLVPEKGVEDLVEMLEHCPPNVSLVFAGDGPMLPLLKQSVERAGKANRVRFLGNVVARDLPAVLNAFDVLALPSRTTPSWKEQFGRVIIEAQACRVPVIGSDSGAIPSVVGDGGIVVPERSPTELARAVSRLLDTPRVLQEMAEAGFAKVHSEYTWEMVARKMSNVYRQMLAARSNSQSTRAGNPSSPESAAVKENS